MYILKIYYIIYLYYNYIFFNIKCLLLGTEGLEPSRTITRQRILSPSCLPIPPHPQHECTVNFLIFYKIYFLKQYVRIFYKIGGTQIRTEVQGFAIHCLTTWLYHLLSILTIIKFLLIN